MVKIIDISSWKYRIEVINWCYAPIYRYSSMSEYRIVFRIHIYNYSNRASHLRLEELITRLVKNKKIRWLSFAQEIPSIHLARIPRDARESPSESQSRRCTRYDSSHEHTANSPSWKIPITSSRGIFIFSNTSALFLFPQSPPFLSLSLSLLPSFSFPPYSRHPHPSNDLTAPLHNSEI